MNKILPVPLMTVESVYYIINKEEYSFSVGLHGVRMIEYHEPKGEGDRHYCDVYFTEDSTCPNTMTRLFNISSINFRTL